MIKLIFPDLTKGALANNFDCKEIRELDLRSSETELLGFRFGIFADFALLGFRCMKLHKLCFEFDSPKQLIIRSLPHKGTPEYLPCIPLNCRVHSDLVEGFQLQLGSSGPSDSISAEFICRPVKVNI
jgi:hypothetical protein